MASLLQQLLVLHLSGKNRTNKGREKIWKNLERNWIQSYSKIQARYSKTSKIKISLKVLKKEDHCPVIHLLINLGFKQIIWISRMFNQKKKRKTSNTLKFARESSKITKILKWCWSKPRTMFSKRDWKFKSRLCRLKIL